MAKGFIERDWMQYHKYLAVAAFEIERYLARKTHHTCYDWIWALSATHGIVL